jgi:hypothetical protein
VTDAHLAVVPVLSLDAPTSDALEYAATVAPRVLAIHLRSVAAETLERNWSSHGERPPLVIVEPSAGGLRRVLEVLEHSQQLEQITVVLPRDRDLDLAEWSAAEPGRQVVAFSLRPPVEPEPLQ